MLQLTLCVDDADYDALIDRFLPQIADQLGTSGNPIGRLLSNSATAGLAKKYMQSMSQEKKERFLADLINGNQEEITAWIEDAGQRQGIAVRVACARAEWVDTGFDAADDGPT